MGKLRMFHKSQSSQIMMTENKDEKTDKEVVYKRKQLGSGTDKPSSVTEVPMNGGHKV